MKLIWYISHNTVGEKDQSKIVVWIMIKLYYQNSYDFFVTLRINAIKIKLSSRFFYNHMYNVQSFWKIYSIRVKSVSPYVELFN